LEAGADDYVAKDSAREVFLARVRRLVRYRQMANTSILNEQLAQIGRLLAGIVHEIRGPVGVIRGNAELMKMQLGRDDPAIQFADPIIRGTQLLQLRLEHLMATVRGGPPLLRLLELAPLVSEAADYFRKGIDSRQGRVQLMTDLERPLPQVRADAGRLIQVLLNLMANAREAILAHRETGQIVLRSRVGSARPVLLPNSSAAQENTQTQSGPSGSASEVSSEPETMGSDPHTGQGVVIEVLDDGPGLPEDLMERVFEPFFTTKETGTGYGLYLACEILREHGGHLTASNRTEGGACFTLWLPSASTVPESSPQSETGSEIAHE